MPIEIAYKDFNDAISTLINNSGLPAFVVASTLRNVLYQVDRIADADYRRALAEHTREKPDAKTEADEIPPDFGKGEFLKNVETHTASLQEFKDTMGVTEEKLDG